MRSWPAIDVGTGFSRPDDEDPDFLQAALTDFDVAAIDETAADSWRVYFHDAGGRDRALAALRTAYPDVRLSPVDIPDQDWAARSQAQLTRITAGNIIVAPPWDVPVVITIQPSMGFGTGHHATTRLCLTALQRLEVKGRTVLDVGCGSAVLAIAASLLGAADATGIDDDPDAIHAAWENLALNPGSSVTLIVGDLRSTELSPTDVVLANLTGGLLVASADRLQQLTRPGGRLILSGLQLDEEAAVIAGFAGRTIEYRAEEDGWVALTLS